MKKTSPKKTSKPLTGADVIVKSLIKEGVTHVFGIPGGATLPIFNALYGTKIRLVLTRHEQGASHMADGFSRSTGRVGVCLATSGPGATNLVTGLATAHMDSIPVVAITGQVATHLIGNDAFQEADATGVMRPVTKHNYMVKDPQDLAKTIQEAFHIAQTGRPGPVHIDIPVDVQKATTDYSFPKMPKLRSYKPKMEGHPRQIEKAVQMINKAERPLLYVGGGAVLSGAWGELKKLSEKADIPVVHTLMANGAFPFNHPNYVGVLGMHGRYSSNTAMQHCDVLISAGARFDDRVTGNLSTFSRQSKKIHIDIDPANIGKSVPVEVPVVGDVKTVLSDINSRVHVAKHKKWRKEIHAWEERHPFVVKRKKNVLQPQVLIEELHRQTKGKAIVATGVGQHQMWAMQRYPSALPRTFLTSGGLGTMGYGFPAAIGAKFGNEDRPVVCIDGDGSFQMTMCEMGTAVLERIKVITIIINNYYLGMVRQWQELFYEERYSGSNLTEKGSHISDGDSPAVGQTDYIPNFVKFADAYGIKGKRIFNNEDIEDTIKEALASKNSYLIEAMISPAEKVFPMVPAGAGLDEIIVDMA